MAERRSTQAGEEEPLPQVVAAMHGQESVQSASMDLAIPDALGNEPTREPVVSPTEIKDFGEAGTAAVTDPSKVQTGPYGTFLPHGEVDGGAISKVLETIPSENLVQTPMAKEQAAIMTPVYRKIAGIVGRPPSEWGLVGPGEVIRGHMLLLDLHSGQKVRAMDGHRVNRGELYANLRSFPESLATGDLLERVLKGD